MKYYIGLATVIFFGFFVKKNPKKYLIFSLVLLWLFTALHNPYINGTDGISYRNYFITFIPKLMNFGQYDHEYEIGFALLNSIAKTIHNDYFVFQVFYTTISILLLGIVLEKSGLEDNEKSLLLFVYFAFRYFQNAMEFLRQNIAIEIVWIGFLTLKEDKSSLKRRKLRTVLEYVWFFAARLFHRSALFNLFLIPIIKRLKKIDKVQLTIYVAIISVICIGLAGPVINRLINLAIQIGGERYKVYLIEGSEAAFTFNPINYMLRWVFILLFLIQVRYLKYEKKDIVFAIACMAVICGSISAGIFTRMLEYYMIGIYIMITLSYRAFFGKYKYLYVFLVYILFLVILVRNLHTVSAGTYMNYQLYPFGK